MSYHLFDYRLVVEPDAGGRRFSAHVVEIPEITSSGDSPAAAMKNLLAVHKKWLETAAGNGAEIPVPFKYRGYGEEVTVSMPRDLYESLVNRSRQERTTLNETMVTYLTRGMTDTLHQVETKVEEIRQTVRRLESTMLEATPGIPRPPEETEKKEAPPWNRLFGK